MGNSEVKLMAVAGVFWMVTGCASSGALQKHPGDPGLAPDYGRIENWAASPEKEDPADAVPEPLRAQYRKENQVDVFFVHPTTFTGKFYGQWNAAITNEDLNTLTDETSIKFQASVFNECNVYAPRYRQAHIKSFFDSDTLRSNAALDLAYEDVRASFQYYLDHWNQGRPIIVAAHSQGTRHAKRLIREFFEGNSLREKLVAAYLIGMPIEPGYFRQIPICADSLQTGCVLGWRTFREGFEPDYDSSYRRSLVVNPLNWKADSSYAASSLSKGAVLRKFNEVVTGVNDARVHKDLLWISRPRFPGSWLFRSKNYHIGDINLFYVNIRENVRTRIAAYSSNRAR